jgi:DASS family divalent anion:Na+ symporter
MSSLPKHLVIVRTWLRAHRGAVIKWIIILSVGLIIYLCPIHNSFSNEEWQFASIFTATILGVALKPTKSSVIVLLSIVILTLTGTMQVEEALGGYRSYIVWLVLAALFISRGITKTKLGERIAYFFISIIGGWSLGLGYALVLTDMILAALIPSTTARIGIIFPIAESVSLVNESHPNDESSKRLGGFLMPLLYQCDVIICALFLTGQASNLLIAYRVKEITKQDLDYYTWFKGAAVPAAVSLLVVSFMLYRFFPPGLKQLPASKMFAKAQLKRLGRITPAEIIMSLVYAVIIALLASRLISSTDPAMGTIAVLAGICLLLLCGVLEGDDVFGNRVAWETFVWYGGLVGIASSPIVSSLIEKFLPTDSPPIPKSWPWWVVLAVCVLIYFYAHYGFASITVHVTAMFTTFLTIVVKAGAPPLLAAALLAYFSNLSASLTHYGTTAAPIYFSAGYVRQRTWWTQGFLASLLNIICWILLGLFWWKYLGWW